MNPSLPLSLPVCKEGLWMVPGHPEQISILKFNYGDMVEMLSEEEEGTYGGELEAYFDPVAWSTDAHGLVYTDPAFLTALQAWFTAQGVKDAETLSYTEAGMQGADYVSLEASRTFAESLIASRVVAND